MLSTDLAASSTGQEGGLDRENMLRRIADPFERH